MAKRVFKWFLVFLLAVAGVMGAIYISLATTEGKQAADYTFFRNQTVKPLVIAHRGGAGIAPENTLAAFQKSFELGVDVLELDVRGTVDGELVVIHDARVDRTTDKTGEIHQMTLADVKKLDAGYKWTPDSGQTFPFRGKNVSIPTLREVLDAFPTMRFNIEPKQQTPSIVKPLCTMIRERRITEKVVVASFSQTILDEFRRECPEVATSASTTEVGKFLAMFKTGVSEAYSPAMQALQIPENAGVQIVSREFIEAARERNLQVHVWTVNQTEDMKRLIELGVDGVMTDYPDRLLKTLGRLK